MATFVLCHGAHGGGWQWRTVADLLRANGHTVFTPTLTGHGERVHLANPDIDLDTFITDVANVIRFEELDDVILLGHSFGGMVITGVADLIPEKLSHLIYLDAYVPKDGESASDLLGPEIVAQIMALVEQYGEGWMVPHIPLPDEIPDPRYVPLPLKTATQPVRSRNPAAWALPRTFIYCTEEKELMLTGQPIVDAAQVAKNDAGWRYYELQSGHVPSDTMPDELAKLLNRIVAQAETA